MDLLISNFKGYNVYKYESNINKNLRNLYFYISTSKIEYSMISNSSICISYIHFIYDIESASLVFLNTKKLFTNKGFASFLLKTSIKYLKNKKVKKIELDDMSNHAHSKSNIYRNFGFRYINSPPEPEMILDLN